MWQLSEDKILNLQYKKFIKNSNKRRKKLIWNYVKEISQLLNMKSFKHMLCSYQNHYTLNRIVNKTKIDMLSDKI